MIYNESSNGIQLFKKPLKKQLNSGRTERETSYLLQHGMSTFRLSLNII